MRSDGRQFSCNVYTDCMILLAKCYLLNILIVRDKHYGMQLYHSNPSGNYSGWKATAIGANNQSAQSILKSDYKDELTSDEAVKLALKVLNKTMDSTALTPEKVELVTVSRVWTESTFENKCV